MKRHYVFDGELLEFTNEELFTWCRENELAFEFDGSGRCWEIGGDRELLTNVSVTHSKGNDIVINSYIAHDDMYGTKIITHEAIFINGHIAEGWVRV